MRLSPLEAFGLFCFLFPCFTALIAFIRKAGEHCSDIVQFRAVLRAAPCGMLEVCYKVAGGAGYLRYHCAIRRKFEFFIYCHDLFSLSPPSGGIHKI